MDDGASVIEPAINFDMKWTKEHEKIFIDWADKAMCYRWLHASAHIVYSRLNMIFTIPVIIISTITGTANFAQDRVPADYLSLFVMVVGGFNLLAGIISTIQQFLGITSLKESHRVSSIAWDKFYRNIKIELSKQPTERIPVAQMLKIYKEEYDRLMETSPVIEDKIIKKFKETFKDKAEFIDVKKPEICDELISTASFLYIDNKKNFTKAMPFIDKLKQETEKHQKLIDDYIKEFQKSQDRKPFIDEIIEHLSNDIPEDKLKRLLNSSKYNLSDNTDSETSDKTTINVSL